MRFSPLASWAARVSAASLALAAVVVAAPSLAFPLGRDHGVPFVVARALLRHGAAPYVDTVDARPPGEYLTYLAPMLLLGARPLAVRAGEFAALVVLAWASARAVAPHARGAGPFAAAALAAALFVFGFHGFWDTGRGQVTCAALLAVAIAVVRAPGPRRTVLALALGGAAATAALLVVPSAVPVVGLAGALALRRIATGDLRGGSAARSAGAWIAGAAAPPLLVGVGLALLGALGPAFTTAAACLSPAPPPSPWTTPLADVARHALHLGLAFYPLGGAALASPALVLLAPRASRAARGDGALVLFVAGATFVAYLLAPSWTPADRVLFVLPVALGAAHATARAARALGPTTGTLAVGALAAVAFASSHARDGLLYRLDRSWTYALGPTTAEARETFARSFLVEPLGYFHVDGYLVAEHVRRRTRDGEPVLVRGYEPQVYAALGREWPGRLPTTVPLRHEGCSAPVRAQWAAEDEEDLRRLRPPFVIALPVPEGPDSPAWFEARGYRQVVRIYELVVLERVDDPRP